ncbi:hypothetical protein [Paraburkholderia sediminicola]|uniref:hypothetical protein n=1 Tax=Paraburkholderia sediminicola TaxID=458836 RepID=UPI0038BDD5D4
MLERLKAESNSLESYFTELESELKRAHLKRNVVSKKLGVLSELIKDVDALHAESAVAVQTVAARPEMAAGYRGRSARPTQKTDIRRRVHCSRGAGDCFHRAGKNRSDCLHDLCAGQAAGPDVSFARTTARLAP